MRQVARKVENWWGSVTERVNQYAAEIGTCSRDFDRAVVDEPAGSWGIVLLGPILLSSRTNLPACIDEAESARE